MVKNGTQHLESLRDGREVYIDGQRVQNHVDHPAFRNAVRSAAGLYDYQARPANLERADLRFPGSLARPRGLLHLWHVHGAGRVRALRPQTRESAA